MQSLFDVNKINQIGRFDFWITNPPFDLNLKYYLCLLTESEGNVKYYINLYKDERFPCVDFKSLPKEISQKKLDKGLEEPIEDIIYREEYRHYMYGKEMNLQMPLWYLHHSSVLKIINFIQNIK